jgi:hypothetical protein
MVRRRITRRKLRWPRRYEMELRANFAEEAHQSDRNTQETTDDPKKEYVRSGRRYDHGPDAEYDYADRDQIR